MFRRIAQLAPIATLMAIGIPPYNADALIGARERLAQAQGAREAAERAVTDALEQLALERTAREAAEVAVRETREQLIQERTARKAAERALKDLRGGHRGPNDLGHLFDLGQLFFFGPRFFDH